MQKENKTPVVSSDSAHFQGLPERQKKGPSPTTLLAECPLSQVSRYATRGKQENMGIIRR
jgi:hypothetical protein